MLKYYGQMACEGSPDCCDESTDHSLIGPGPDRLNEEIDGRCYICLQLFNRLTASQSQITVISLLFSFCLCFLNG